MNMTMREAYEFQWNKEGLCASDDRKAVYFERSLNIPSLVIDNLLHFVFVFPAKEYDYQVNMTAKPATKEG